MSNDRFIEIINNGLINAVTFRTRIETYIVNTLAAAVQMVAVETDVLDPEALAKSAMEKPDAHPEVWARFKELHEDTDDECKEFLALVHSSGAESRAPGSSSKGRASRS